MSGIPNTATNADRLLPIFGTHKSISAVSTCWSPRMALKPRPAVLNCRHCCNSAAGHAGCRGAQPVASRAWALAAAIAATLINAFIFYAVSTTAFVLISQNNRSR